MVLGAKLPDTYALLSATELLNAYEAAPQRIKQVLEGLQEKELKAILQEGKWSIFQIVLHLADAEIVGAMRIRQAYTQSDRLLAYYDQDMWATALDYHSLDMAAFYMHMKLFQMLRQTTVSIFRRANAEDWQKTVVHPERGELNLRRLLELYADHGERHIAQIIECRRLLEKPLVVPLLLPERLY